MFPPLANLLVLGVVNKRDAPLEEDVAGLPSNGVDATLKLWLVDVGLL